MQNPNNKNAAASESRSLSIDRATLAVVSCTPLFAATMGYGSAKECVLGFFAGIHLGELTRMDLMTRSEPLTLVDLSKNPYRCLVTMDQAAGLIVLSLEVEQFSNLTHSFEALFPEYGVAQLCLITGRVRWLSAPPLPLGPAFSGKLAHRDDLALCTVPDDFSEMDALLQHNGTRDIRFVDSEGVIINVQVRTVTDGNTVLIRFGQAQARQPVNALTNHFLQKKEIEFEQTILVVEDDALVRRYLTKTLGAQGHTVIAAANATAAMETLGNDSNSITLIVSDLNLPDSRDGGFVTAVRQLFPALKIISCSGNPDPGLAHAHARKPVTREQLASLIAGLMP